MKGKILLGCALALAAMLDVSATRAGEVAWQVPLYAVLPSVTGLGQQAVGRSSEGEPRLYVSASWSVPGERSHAYEIPSVLAFDLANGASLWRRDLHEECGQHRRDVETLGKLVSPLPGGDVAVAFEMRYAVSLYEWSTYVCYGRLSGADGRVLWTRVDAPVASDQWTFRVFAIAADRNGDLVATGTRGDRPRTFKLSGRTGESLWTFEGEPVHRDYHRSAFAVDAGTGDVALLTAIPFAGGVREQAMWLNGRDGHPRWRQTLCENFFYGGRVRVVDTGAITFALHCGQESPADMPVTLGRLASGDGATVWQRSLRRNASGDDEKYQIDESGDVFLVGDLNLDGETLGAASFAAEDGRLRWSLPGKLGGWIEGTTDSVSLNVAVGGGRLHVWETIGDTRTEWASSTRLSSYDAGTGNLLGRRDLRDSERDALNREGSMVALPDGGLAFGGISSSGGNGWLWIALARPSPDLVWVRRELIAAPQPMVTAPVAADAARSVWAVSSAGIAGILVAGLADGDSTANAFQWGVPSVIKLAQNDGRVLWRWQPQFDRPSSRGKIHGVAADSAGSVYVVGRWDEAMSIDSAPFAARIDAATGATHWQSSTDARALILDAEGQPFVANGTTLRRLSAIDGAALWTASLPDTSGPEGKISLAIGADGDPVVATFYTTASDYGVQVVKFRAGDGVPLWQRRFPRPWLADEKPELQALANGDVVLMNPPARLAGTSGEVVWQRPELRPNRILAGADGQLVLGDVQKTVEGGERVQLTRVDSDTGRTSWSVAYPAGVGALLGSAPMAFDHNGDLLVAHGTHSGYELARLAIANGTISWRAGIAIPEIFASPPTGLIRRSDAPFFEHLFLVADVFHPEESHSVATVVKIDVPAPVNHSERPSPRPARSTSR